MFQGNVFIRVRVVVILLIIAIYATGTHLSAQDMMSTPTPSSSEMNDRYLEETEPHFVFDFVRLLPIEQYSPIWQEFVHRLGEEVENNPWAQNLIESSFVFDVDMLRQYKDGILAPEVQIGNLANILLGSGETKFELSKQALNKLKAEGLSDKILIYLEQLLEHEFFEEKEFLAAVEERIGKEMTLQYENQLLQYAVVEDLLLLKAPPKSRQDAVFAEYAFKESVAAWGRVLYYPRKLKEILSIAEYEEPQQPQIYPPNPVNERSFYFRLRRFFKEWGLPRPGTVLLIGILIYLAIALITRLSS